MVNKKNRLAGRFLPSRVYARWKWTVRCGLCAVPLILFLSGSLVLYLTPRQYESKTGFEYLGKRPLREVTALLKSRNVIGLAVSATDLVNRINVDKETAIEIVAGTMKVSVDAAGMIEVKVRNTQKEIARDLAAELPKALETYETTLANRALESRLAALKSSVRDAEDNQEEMRKVLVKIIQANGEAPANPLAALNLDAARRDWENAQNQRHQGEARYLEAGLEMARPPAVVTIHSNPEISQTPVEKKPGETLGMVILQALGTGLAFALAIPYLLELAFPRRIRRVSAGKDAWEDVAVARDPGLEGVSVNC